jgi:hypothetical protein
VKPTKIPFHQAKAVNRKADNVTGMKQPEMKHDVSLSHEGGDLSLGLLKKEKRALPCNEVSPENPQFLKHLKT